MAEQTAEEAQKANIAAMGEQLGKVYSALWQDTAALCFRWSECKALFAGKPERIELLNRAAPRFFYMVQSVLFESVILQIARMLDPPRTMGKDNLTLPALKEIEKDPGAQKLVDEALKGAEAMRDWRHRLLAHRDQAVALGTPAHPIKATNVAGIQKAIDSIVAVLNAVAVLYNVGTTSFGHGVGAGGAVAMLYVLDNGLRAQEEQQRRLERGEYRPEDDEPRDL